MPATATAPATATRRPSRRTSSSARSVLIHLRSQLAFLFSTLALSPSRALLARHRRPSTTLASRPRPSNRRPFPRAQALAPPPFSPLHSSQSQSEPLLARQRAITRHGRRLRLAHRGAPTPGSPPPEPTRPQASPRAGEALRPEPASNRPPEPRRRRSPPPPAACSRRRPSSGHLTINRDHLEVALVSLMLPHPSLVVGKYPIAGIELPEPPLFQKSRPGTSCEN